MALGRRDVMLGMAAAGLGAAPPPDLGTLLAAVAARYAGLTCYTLGITHWREMGGGRKTMRLVYGDEAHFRFAAPESVLVADGDFCWQYRAEGREYLREPVGQVDARVRAEFNRLREQFVGRFRELPRLLPVARAMGEQRVPGTKLALPQIEIAPRDGAWLEHIWVDPVAALVVQSAFSRLLTTQGRQWVYHRFAFQPDVDGAAFWFTPPAKARQVERFSTPPVPIEAIPL